MSDLQNIETMYQILQNALVIVKEAKEQQASLVPLPRPNRRKREIAKTKAMILSRKNSHFNNNKVINEENLPLELRYELLLKKYNGLVYFIKKIVKVFPTMSQSQAGWLVGRYRVKDADVGDKDSSKSENAELRINTRKIVEKMPGVNMNEL